MFHDALVPFAERWTIIMKKREPVVGVIVPIYKVEMALVRQCVMSIVNQTYKNIKIVLVDDGNDADYVCELERLANVDNRISIIKNSENAGLYKSRLMGVKNCQTEYVAFVDADDSITIDWIRLLVKKAVDDDADIVMGKTINIDENGWKYVLNSNYSYCNRTSICNEKIMDLLMEDGGLDFSIHTMWNKLYRRSLWNRAWDDLNRVDKHLIMTEDILFSFELFYYAKKMSFSNHDGYMYYRNEKSSTISACNSEKIRKNINDLEKTFSEISDFLIRKNINEKYKENWQEWKNRYFRWWSYNVREACVSLSDHEKNEVLQSFLKVFQKKQLEYAVKSDSYFSEKKIGWNDALEKIKKKIASDECDVVSFDLFDTLIVRPVLEPDDVFEVVMNDLNIELSKRKTIKSVRKLAENLARRKITIKYPQYEDITLSEIYCTLNTDYEMSKELCDKLKIREEQVEIEFAQRRQVGFELFTLAQECGKKIFITSDMYLELPVIEAILDKNEYKECNILLSSRERLLKSTGHLFEKLIMKSGGQPNRIVHIGDNWQYDHITASKYGIQSYFIPKTKDILLNYLGDVNTGNAIEKATENIENIMDVSKQFSSFPVRCMYANVANCMFDNPFVSFYGESDYNGDPYYLGCFAVGMHMFGIAKWLSDLVDKGNYKNVHFMARDGYYLKVIYDLIRGTKMSMDGRSNYLYASRKAFIPLDISSRDDIEKIYAELNYRANTAQSVINRYSSILRSMSPEIERSYKEYGFLLDKPFESEAEWFKFVKCMKKVQFSEEKAKANYYECVRYLKKNIHDGDIVFDLGYSGNLHSKIIEAVGFPVAGAYVNFSGYDALHKNEEEKLKIKSYYDFVPTMHGIVTEYIFSDRNPSCIGYLNENPVFEDKMHDAVGDYVVNEINRGAYDFANRFIFSWSNRMSIINIMPVESGIQFEKFLVAPTTFDRTIFNSCYVEDEYYGGIRNKEINEIWSWQLNDRKVKSVNPIKEIHHDVKIKPSIEEMEYQLYLEKIEKRNLLIKALYWLCVNKTFFFTRIRDYVRRKR